MWNSSSALSVLRHKTQKHVCIFYEYFVFLVHSQLCGVIPCSSNNLVSNYD